MARAFKSNCIAQYYQRIINGSLTQRHFFWVTLYYYDYNQKWVSHVNNDRKYFLSGIAYNTEKLMLLIIFILYIKCITFPKILNPAY